MNNAARSRGVSLIEALVALAVMAFGLLGVVGMQATLRFNADVSRQRAEAVRMAQEQMENMRSFGVLSGAALPTDHEYVDIITGTDYPAPPSGFANTAFTRVGERSKDEERAGCGVLAGPQGRCGWANRIGNVDFKYRRGSTGTDGIPGLARRPLGDAAAAGAAPVDTSGRRPGAYPGHQQLYAARRACRRQLDLPQLVRPNHQSLQRTRRLSRRAGLSGQWLHPVHRPRCFADPCAGREPHRSGVRLPHDRDAGCFDPSHSTGSTPCLLCVVGDAGLGLLLLCTDGYGTSWCVVRPHRTDPA